MARMMRESITIQLPLKSKARPRAFRGQAIPYMPPDYKKWKKDFRAQLAEWWVREPLEIVNVISFRFTGPARGDLDNLIGAVFDAGNGLVWVDDRVSVISKLSAEHIKAKAAQSSIEIRLWWLP